jgi:hypothetical protein
MALAKDPIFFFYIGTFPSTGAWRVPRVGGVATSLGYNAPFGPIVSLDGTLYFSGPVTVDSSGKSVPLDPLFSIVQYHGSLVSTFGGRLYYNVSRIKSELPPAPAEWDFRVYDPVAKSFTTIASFPFSGSHDYSSVAANGEYACAFELAGCVATANSMSAVLPLPKLEPNPGDHGQLAMDATYVYLSNYVPQDGCDGVRRALPTGDQQQIVYAAPTNVYGLALDATHVYFFDEAKGAIMRIHK